MSSVLQNSTPRFEMIGTSDQSVPKALPEMLENPIFQPKLYIYAAKGPLGPQQIKENTKIAIYGKETFDENSKFYTHATLFSNLLSSKGNAHVIERVIPDDAGPTPNVLISLDILKTEVPVYERNFDGSYKRDENGVPVNTGVTIPGYRYKFVKTYLKTHGEMQQYGLAQITAGDQIDPDTSEQSQRYPIFEARHSSIGASGNNDGFIIYPQVGRGVSDNYRDLMVSQKTIPYAISMIRRLTESSTADVQRNMYDEAATTFTFKEGVLDPLTNRDLSLTEGVLGFYQKDYGPDYPKMSGDIESFHIYQENLNQILADIYALEKEHIDTWSDITGVEGEEHLINFLTGVSTSLAPYVTYVPSKDLDGIIFGQYTNIYLGGGSDGTLSEEEFAKLVDRKLAEFENSDSQCNDIAINPESVFIDSGFPVETKENFLKVLTHRKDIFVWLTTYISGARPLTASEENSLALSLLGKAMNYPDSFAYATGCFRVGIAANAYKNKAIRKRGYVPALYDVVSKSSDMMGSGDGVMNLIYDMTEHPNNVAPANEGYVYSWLPPSAREKMWQAGIVYVQKMDLKRYFYPGFKTIYSRPSSVLVNYPLAMTICALTKLSHQLWTEFSGRDLTKAQLIERAEARSREINGKRFGSKFIIIPKIIITELDENLGWRWTHQTTIQAGTQKTVQRNEFVVLRKQD